MLTQNISFDSRLEYAIIKTSKANFQSGYFHIEDILSKKSTILFTFIVPFNSDEAELTVPSRYQSFFDKKLSTRMALKTNLVPHKSGLILPKSLIYS